MVAVQSESSGPICHTLIQGSQALGHRPGNVPVRDQAAGQIVSGGHESKAVCIAVPHHLHCCLSSTSSQISVGIINVTHLNHLKTAPSTLLSPASWKNGLP